MSAMAASRCPTPFAFPFTPLGLSLFDIDPSRILSLLHHQTWLAEEALRTRGLLAAPKDFPHRFTTLSDLLTKDFQPGQPNTTATATATTATSSSSSASASAGNPAGKQPTGSFNLRYPTPTAFYQREPSKVAKSSPSPQQMATSSTTTGLSNDSGEDSCKRSSADSDEVTIVELPSERSAQLYKESLEQLLQRQRRTPILGGATGAGSVIVDATGLRQYTQLLLASGQAEAKEKGTSSSSSSSTPPLMNHQHLSQMLKSPSDTCSSLFSSGGGGGGGSSTGETIEEETRCVVCNAHFPNVWLLEQHAALQHPHVGPGEEKPFICEQCGQSYRYRSAYAKHKEQNHRARLPADKLFTCDVCGMQFRYLKSFKKHRLNHALERLHGKKSVGVGVNVGLGRSLTVAAPTSVSVSASASGGSSVTSVDQDVVTSSQEPMLADEGEDLRVNVKREGTTNIPTTNSETGEQSSRESRGTADSEEHEQDNTVDSAGITMLYQDNNSSASASTSATEPNISSSDGIHSTNKRARLHHLETDPSYPHQQHHQHPHQHPHHHHHHHHGQQQPHHHSQPGQLPPHLGHVALPLAATSGAGPSSSSAAAAAAVVAAAAANSGGSTSGGGATGGGGGGATGPNSGGISSLSSLTSLINAERIPNEQFLGLNPQEASILNFLRVDAAERQRDKRPATSRFACPFCGKCVRSKENLKLHVRKHTGERPFVCLFCGRAFGGKSDLTRHLRIHTGERPYHCESCGKCFARADYLSKHLTTHIHNAPR
ncbi:zinc finger protein 316 isoform X4 [Drosophila bipectinata]